MKIIWNILLLGIAGVAVAASPAWVRDGKADYAIAIPDDALPPERKAAGELARYLGRITGMEFPVVAESAVAAGQKAAYVGRTDYAWNHGIDLDALNQEEWIIRTDPDGNLILTGGKLRGILYAVYDYLERQAGVRWLDETVEVVPSDPGLTIGAWDLRRQPYFGNRWIFDRLDWFPVAGRFKEYNKGFSYSQADNGMARLIGGNRPHHTFSAYCASWPKDKLELYALTESGERLIPTSGEGPGQICMTNPEARARTLEQLRQFIAADRADAAAKGYPPPAIYDISQNDNYQKCVCHGCRAIAEREGSYAAPLMDFINEIAREIHKEYPDIFIRTFAYQYSQKPPATMRAEDNVIIHLTLGGIEGGGAYGSYDTQRALSHPFNAATRELIASWVPHTGHIARWEYWTLYPMYPEPYVRVNAIPGDLKFDRDNHVSYLFAEYEDPHWNSFFALTRYLGYKLMDDPDADASALIAMFLDDYYGPAAATMGELLDYIQQRQDSYDQRIAGVDVSRRAYLDDAFFATTFDLLDRAEREAKGDPELIARIRRERPPLLGGLLMRWKYLSEPEKRYDHAALMREFHDGTLASLEHYFPDDTNGFKSEITRELAKAEQRFAANAIVEPVPPELGTTTGDVVDLNARHFLQEGMRAQLIDDPEAFHGKAMKIALGDAATVPLSIDNWMDGVTLVKEVLPREKLAGDGKYHWVPLGRVTFTNNGRAHFYVPDTTGIRCDLYRLFEPGSSYDAYVSLKLTGNDLYVDRLIFKQ